MFQPSYGLITDLGELRDYVNRIIADDRAFSWDLETGYHGDSREKASLHPEENFIAGISLTNSLKWSRYVPLAHDTGPNVDQKAVAEILYPLLVRAQPLGVAHGGKFELRVTRPWLQEQLGIELDYRAFRLRSDTMLESYAEAVNRSHGLKELSELQAEADRSGFWHKQLELEELYPEKLTAKARKCIRFNVLNPQDPKVQQYVCEDALYTLAHHRMRHPRLQEALRADSNRGPGFIWKLEMAVLPVVCEMEDEGLWYDWTAMREWAAVAKNFAARYMEEIRADFGELRGAPLEPSFNFGSPIQLRRLLYSDCGMPVRHWTKGGKTGNKQPGTDAKVALKGLSATYPEVAKYLEWKRLTKLYRDFLEAFEVKYCFAADRRAHPSLIQHGVPAGRFAHNDPNYAQSPKKYHYELRDGSVFDFNYRTMIGAPPGWYLVGFDLAQAELRAIAGMAGEEKMLQAFRDGVDVHSVTASLIFGIPVESVSKDQRDVGKAQPLDEPVLTPTGWRLMGDLKPGDTVLGSAGLPIRVLGVYPQGVKPVFEVELADGSVTRSCDEHYWTVHSKNWRREKTLQLSEIRKQLFWSKNEAKYWLPQMSAPQLAGCELPVDPYLLGLLLGDGSFRGHCPSFSSEDGQLLDSVRGALEQEGMTLKHADRCSYWITWAGEPKYGKVMPLTAALKHMGLWQKNSHGKFIPRDYLLGRPDDRLALLRGLLDTDGTPSSAGAEYCTVSDQLAADVQELVRSLGGTAKATRNSTDSAWRIYIRMGHGIQLFGLERKAQFYKPRQVPQPRRTIVSVKPAGEVPVQCIQVESPDGLYFTRDYILTHNTMGLALVYGLTEQGLADRLGISVQQAEDLFAAFHAAYPKIKEWTERTIRYAQETGYVETWWGRRVRMWDIDSSDRRKRQEAQRTAGNAPVQGSATGDYMKLAMVRAEAALHKAGLKDRVRLVMNVHDALEFYVRKDVKPAEVIRVLQPAVIFPVRGWPPLLAEWHIGERWGSVRELDVQLAPDGAVQSVRLASKDGAPEELDIELGDEDEEDVAPASEQVRRMAAAAGRVDHGSRAAAGHPVREEDSAGGPGVGAGVPDPGPVPAVAQRDNGSASPRTVVVQVRHAVRREDVETFVRHCKFRPGPNTVILRMPGGEAKLDFTTGLSPADAALVSVTLGGASVHYDEQSVDLEALGAGVIVLWALRVGSGRGLTAAVLLSAGIGRGGAREVSEGRCELEVRSGWNSEFARKKYDVTLDEADLARILLGFGIPLEAQATVPVDDAHTVLYTTAEIMSRQTLAVYAREKPSEFPDNFRKHLAEEARALRDKRTEVLTGIKSAWEAQQELHRDRSG